MNKTQKLWEKLKPGDAIISKKLDPIFRSIVLDTVTLEKSKKGIILSTFADVPVTVEQIDMPMHWSKERECIINAVGVASEPYQDIIIKKNLHPEIPKEYKELQKLRNLSKEQVIAIAKTNKIKIAEIDAILKTSSKSQLEVMAFILNRTLGPDGYTDEQLVILSQILETYRQVIDFQQDNIEQRERDLKFIADNLAEQEQVFLPESHKTFGWN